MNKIRHEAVIFAVVVVHAVLAAESVKIVNSTNIKELKLTIPQEDKTGAVAYVYAVQSTEPTSSEGPTTTDSDEKSSRQDEENLSTLENTNNKRKCVTRVIEKMKGDERTVHYNATAEEAKAAGKTIIDTVCEGDGKFDMATKVNLANLGDDIYHLP